jgi:predicted RNA binding protein YcfA (HicA-like mRNA interferase family)
MKVRDVIKKVEKDGWRYMYTTGSHRHFKHPDKPGKVTIPGHPSDEATPGTLKSILKQAGLQ